MISIENVPEALEATKKVIKILESNKEVIQRGIDRGEEDLSPVIIDMIDREIKEATERVEELEAQLEEEKTPLDIIEEILGMLGFEVKKEEPPFKNLGVDRGRAKSFSRWALIHKVPKSVERVEVTCKPVLNFPEMPNIEEMLKNVPPLRRTGLTRGEEILRREQQEREREELEVASSDLVDWLYEHGTPHTTLLVTQEGVEVMDGRTSLKFDGRD